MSLSRSPSPRPGGGWSSPGLTNPYATVSGRSSPTRAYGVNGGTNTVTWESAKAKSNGVNGYPSFSTQSKGFFNRHMRSLSASLPRFNIGAEKSYAEKEKLGRGRWMPRDGTKLAKLRILILNTSRKAKIRFLIVTAFIFMVILFYMTRKVPNCQQGRLLTNLALHYWWRRSKIFGGGKKFVIILAANQGGGVMEWKGPREWAIERDSVKNKKKYINRWGYDLEIVDMSTKKRYAHEWRESWEKVDTIRNCLRKYPDAEWYENLAPCLEGIS
jgi:mannan polymerase II complex MNN10 subunit